MLLYKYRLASTLPEGTDSQAVYFISRYIRINWGGIGRGGEEGGDFPSLYFPFFFSSPNQDVF